ncbi:MAG: pyridoxal-phosphate dependent enzyme [Actinomycetota bacterium]|nr:pyridoxal-phosphate dependent enzyme [Actinomycetota bacterium]
MIGLADVEKAAARLEGTAHRTPVFTSRTLDARTGARVFLKAENLQRGGAFKFRGAYNKISSLAPDKLRRGVATYSSGNHAQAVALSARLLGARAVILMPADAPPAKVEATGGYGAEIVTYDRYSENRAQLGEALAAERGLTLIPPYDDDLIIAGQGTAALELIEDHGPLDLLVVPVGGGGLIAGSAIVATSMIPGIRVTGVEPAAGDDTRRSLEQGRPVRIPVPQTIADGQQVEMPGRITFSINQKLVDEIAVVTDGEIIGAMAFAVDYLKTVVEPSGASGLAAVLARNITLEGARVGVILSGGNVGARRLAELLGRVS